MMKLFVSLPALALVVALSGSAVADNGISQTTLQDMGLAGIELMSDADAMEIRGLGYNGGGHQEPPTSDKPWTLAFGISYAKVEDGRHAKGSAGTLDGFVAEGKYLAAGEHFSEAGRVTIESHELQVGGAPVLLEINTKSLRVFAGGFASGSSL
jgi:hypothetical protein